LQITGAGLQALCTLPLTSLDLRLCKGLGARIEPLKLITTLTRLDLTSCDEVTDSAVEHLGSLSRLQTLHLNGCSRLTHVSLVHLSHLGRLCSLGASMWRHLHDSGVAHLPRGVTDLNLSWCSSIRRLDSLPSVVGQSLRVLRLDQTPVSGPALASVIPKLVSLECLIFTGCPEAMASNFAQLARALSGLRHLTWLDVSDTYQLRDGFLQALAGSTSLRTLHLMRCQRLSDISLVALSALPALCSLNIVGCNRMTARAIEELAAVRPNLKLAQSHILQ